MTTLYCPDLLYVNSAFEPRSGLLVSDDGRILSIGAAESFSADNVVTMPGKALLPGFVNAHSHSFQRLIRGKAESRVTSGKDFWSWRGTMYHAAASLSLEELYDVARMAFLEMVLAGTTTVGEFHYLHNEPHGRPYDDPNAAAKQIIAAARSIGLRIVLLRSAYRRAGFGLPADPGQSRFYESTKAFIANIEELSRDASLRGDLVHLGIAPHSIRAVPLEDLRAIAAWCAERKLPMHMHVSEQVAENDAALREYGKTPIMLLADAKMLSDKFTAIHAIHISEQESSLMADAGASICSCPTTERNLGDGILDAHQIMSKGIHICLGSDSQAQIDPLEDARELDYHQRLELEQRAILDQIDGVSIASRLFACATSDGARSLDVNTGSLVPGCFADFFTVDLKETSIAGHSPADLLPMIVFSLGRSAIRDVGVHGRLIVKEKVHELHEEIVARYLQVHERVWSQRS